MRVRENEPIHKERLDVAVDIFGMTFCFLSEVWEEFIEDEDLELRADTEEACRLFSVKKYCHT